MKKLSLQTGPEAGFINTVRLVVFISLFASVSNGVLAAQPLANWQTKRLLHPTTAQRVNEQQGRVFIYDGLSEQEIDKAMDRNFDRIGAMMFIHIKKTKVKKPKTGNKGNLKNADEFEDDDDC